MRTSSLPSTDRKRSLRVRSASSHAEDSPQDRLPPSRKRKRSVRSSTAEATDTEEDDGGDTCSSSSATTTPAITAAAAPAVAAAPSKRGRRKSSTQQHAAAAAAARPTAAAKRQSLQRERKLSLLADSSARAANCSDNDNNSSSNNRQVLVVDLFVSTTMQPQPISLCCALHNVCLDNLDHDFKLHNAVYPAAYLALHSAATDRQPISLEMACNEVGWKLAHLNAPLLSGQKCRLQRAVDAYRRCFMADKWPVPRSAKQQRSDTRVVADATPPLSTTVATTAALSTPAPTPTPLSNSKLDSPVATDSYMKSPPADISLSPSSWGLPPQQQLQPPTSLAHLLFSNTTATSTNTTTTTTAPPSPSSLTSCPMDLTAYYYPSIYSPTACLALLDMLPPTTTHEFFMPTACCSDPGSPSLAPLSFLEPRSPSTGPDEQQRHRGTATAAEGDRFGKELTACTDTPVSDPEEDANLLLASTIAPSGSSSPLAALLL